MNVETKQKIISKKSLRLLKSDNVKEKITFIIKQIIKITVFIIFFYSLIFNLVSSNKKYELTNQSIIFCHPENKKEIQLYRIIALKDFFNVKKGELGGFVENYYNLSQSGNSWIYDDAKVFYGGMVLDDAKIYNNSLIYDNSTIMERAIVLDNVKIYNTVTLGRNTLVSKDTVLNEKNSFFTKNKRICNTPKKNKYLGNKNSAYLQKKKELKRKRMIENNKIINEFININGGVQD